MHIFDALDLLHLAVIFESLFDGAVEEEIGHSRLDSMVWKFAGREDLLKLVEDAVGSHAPSFRKIKRDHVRVLSTDGGRPLPSRLKLS